MKYQFSKFVQSGLKVIIVSFSIICAPWGIADESLTAQIEADYGYLDKLYKDLHQTPEISFQEKNTAKKIAGQLSSLGFDVTTDYGGHGVVGILKNGNGPTVMVRTDLDALPIIRCT